MLFKMEEKNQSIPTSAVTPRKSLATIQSIMVIYSSLSHLLTQQKPAKKYSTGKVCTITMLLQRQLLWV